MELFKNMAGAILTAKDYVVEKNRKTALVNRLRTVMKGEEQNAEKAYLALGRYYYHNLRDAANPITEAHCADVDATQKRLDLAIAHLEKLYSEEASSTVIEQIDLDDIEELGELPIPVTTPAEDAVTEGIVDEAVAPASQEESEDENKELPFEG